MSPTVKRLLEEALQLSEYDRAELAASLIESLDPEVETELYEAWNAEIARRLEEIDSGAVRLVPWQEVRRMLRRAVDGQPEG